jgi:2-methylcitrate dehydratase PrpD
MPRVEVVHDQAQEREPRAESARVTVTMRNGERHEVFIDGVVGFPSHPMSHDDVEAKALDLMGPVLGAARARQVVARIWAIDKMTDVGELVTAIAT